jgi:hypothetical protein
MARDQFEAPLLRDCGEQQDAFHPREAFADADARASAEGEVGEFRTLVTLKRPSFWIEAIGIGEPARVAMDHPGAHQ